MSITSDIAYIIAGSALFLILAGSFKRDPYSYKNIALTEVIILLIALLTGKSSYSVVLIFPIGVMCLFLCVSNASLLWYEGFRKSNLLGLIFSFIVFAAAGLIWGPVDLAAVMPGKVPVFLKYLLCYIECTVLSTCIMGYAVLKLKPVYDKDYVIILGCSISKKGKVRPLLKGRVNRAIRFAWDQEIGTGKPVKYVPSGGQGDDEPMSEGSAMEMYLISHSAEECEVYAEKKSGNTKENLIFSKKIIDEQDKNAKVMIVTTNFHVLRSGMLAKRAGFINAQVIGSGTKWYFWPNAFLRELVAIMILHYRIHVLVLAALMVVCLFTEAT